MDQCSRINTSDHKDAPMLFQIQTQSPKCCRCRHSFTNYSKLLSHFSSCQMDEQYDCKVCGKGFHSESDLCIHIEEDHNIQYSCFLCRRNFYYKGHFNMHLFQCHYLRIFWRSKYQCDVCSQHLTSLKTLRDHCIKVHNSVDICFSCYHCSEIISISDIATHYIIKHSESVIREVRGIRRTVKMRPEPEIVESIDIINKTSLTQVETPQTVFAYS